MGEKIRIFDINYELDKLTFIDPTIISNRDKLFAGLREDGSPVYHSPRIVFRGLKNGHVRIFEDYPPHDRQVEGRLSVILEQFAEQRKSFAYIFRHRSINEAMVRRLDELLNTSADMQKHFDKIEVEMRQYAEDVKARVEHYHANRQKAAA